MSQPEPKQPRIFPLHLSPIEEFLAVDNRPRYPMDFVICTELSGDADRTAFEEALREALQRHPLLQSLIKPAKRGLPCWVPALELHPRLDWAGHDVPIALPGQEFIDLGSEIGLRVWVRTGGNRTMITWQFQHTCTDGIGSYRFIGDFLALYGRKTSTGGPLPEVSEIDISLLRQRQYRVTQFAFSGNTKELRRRAWKTAYEILMSDVKVLNPPRVRPASGDMPFPGIETHFFDRTEHERIRAASVGLGCTVNDLLIAALLQTLYAWNHRYPSWRHGKWYRIMMPTDMRETSDYPMPAANLMSYTFINRLVRKCVSARELVAGIRDETARIKNERRGSDFNDAVAGATRGWKKLLPLILSGEMCLATAILSNVGDGAKRFTAKLPRKEGKVVAGNLTLENLTGIPPIRPKTRVTVSAGSYLRKMVFCVRGDPHYFTLSSTREFLSLLVESFSGLVDHGARGHLTFQNRPRHQSRRAAALDRLTRAAARGFAHYFLRWRIRARMRRFFRPTLRRPFPVFFTPTCNSPFGLSAANRQFRQSHLTR